MRHSVVESPVGDLTVAGTDDGLAGVWFSDHRGGVGLELGERDDASFAAVREQLAEYFARERTTFDLPLAPRGDAFSRRVWAALREIPYGRTRSYGDLARELGGVGHSQAVGVANGRNPLSVLVPCHRVVGADGALVGYAGGLWRKRFLLALEEPSAEDGGRLF